MFQITNILLFFSLGIAHAQDIGSGSGTVAPEIIAPSKVSDPFGKVDLSKFELKEGPRGEGERPQDDNAIGHGFDSSKIEELPAMGLEQKAAQLKYEIDMVKKQKSNLSVQPINNEALTVDAFAKQPVQIEKCVGKDIDACMRERAARQLQQDQKNLELEKAVNEKMVTPDVSNSETAPTTSEVPAPAIAPEAVVETESVAVDHAATKVKPAEENIAVAGKEHNVDVVDNGAAPTPVMPESKVDESLLKIQHSIKHNNGPSERMPAQAPNP